MSVVSTPPALAAVPAAQPRGPDVIEEAKPSEPAKARIPMEGRPSSPVPAKCGACATPPEPPRAKKPDSDDPLDKVFERLAEMQIVQAVPSVSSLRSARPLRRGGDEIYAAQFVLQTAQRNFNEYLSSQDGQAEFHPHIIAGDEGSFATLDDGTPVVYQTNGIARTQESIAHRSVKCDKTGAPGHYMETKMLVSRLRVKGKMSSTLQGARSMRTRECVEDNLFYSFTSSWLILACTGTVGELSEEDTGERIFIRRAVKDFTQHHFHDFPVAKSLANLIDDENQVLVKAFCLESASSMATTLFDYQCYTLRAWQTYEFDDKPPKEDVGVMLVAAARIGHVNELHRLVNQCGCDPDTMIAEFGLFGSGRTECFTRSSNAFAEERTALIAAVEAGWLSAVQAIIGFAEDGRADINVVCFDWTPDGQGGAGLRDGQTALDRARLYHYEDIEAELLRAGGKSAKEGLPQPEKRENPFAARQKQDKGENDNRGWRQQEHKNRYADFSFVEFGENFKMDAEMQGIIDGLQIELTEMGSAGSSEGEQRTQFRKLAARWHPDKHPDEKKSLATRVFQWLQRVKDKGWETKISA